MDATYTVGQMAKKLNRTVNCLQKWDRAGILISKRTKTNRRYYTHEQYLDFINSDTAKKDKKIVAYVRVSSSSQRPELKNQRHALETFCIAKGFSNVEFVEEVGGGLNFKRKKFLTLIESVLDREVEHILIAHKDRLARFGYDFIEYICHRHGCEIILLNSEQLSPEQEMVQDLMTIIHCFSSRLYGLRNYKKQLKEALKNEPITLAQNTDLSE